MRTDRRRPFVPGKEPPPVKDRPRCPNCTAPLKPICALETETVPSTTSPAAPHMRGVTPGMVISATGRQYWTGNYQRYGEFCTLRCCESFANAAYKAGYRRHRVEGAAKEPQA